MRADSATSRRPALLGLRKFLISQKQYLIEKNIMKKCSHLWFLTKFVLFRIIPQRRTFFGSVLPIKWEKDSLVLWICELNWVNFFQTSIRRGFIKFISYIGFYNAFRYGFQYLWRDFIFHYSFKIHFSISSFTSFTLDNFYILINQFLCIKC